MAAFSAMCQDSGHNYIVRRVMLDTLGVNTAETVTYYDGLGRKEEVVQRGVMIMLKQVLITKASVQQKLCKPNTMPSLLEHC